MLYDVSFFLSKMIWDLALAVTPHDTNDLSGGIYQALYIGGGGDVAVNMATTGTNITFTGVKQGQILPIEITRVYSTGTTATGLVALKNSER